MLSTSWLSVYVTLGLILLRLTLSLETKDATYSNNNDGASVSPDGKPVNVEAKPGTFGKLIISWQEEGLEHADYFRVTLESLSPRRSNLTETKELRPLGPQQTYMRVFEDLPIRVWYDIHVTAVFNQTSQSGGSRVIDSDHIKYLHDGFPPHISIQVTALTPTTALVTYDAVGAWSVDKLRLLYSDDTSTHWFRLDRRLTFNEQTTYYLAENLKPRQKYFFMAKARVNMMARTTVTHVVMPDYDLAPVRGITVTSSAANSKVTSTTVSSDVTWQEETSSDVTPVLGYIVKIWQKDSSVPVKEMAVIGQTKARIDQLEAGVQYEVVVRPFNLNSVGSPCDDLEVLTFTTQGSFYAPTNEPQEISETHDDAIPTFSNNTHAPLYSPQETSEPEEGPIATNTDDTSDIFYAPTEKASQKEGHDTTETYDVDLTTDSPVSDTETTETDEEDSTDPSFSWFSWPFGGEDTTASPEIEKTTAKVEEEKESAPTPIQYGDTHKINLRAFSLSPNRVDAVWTVDRGDLQAINSFTVIVRDANGHPLLEQRLGGKQRSFTLESTLGSSTSYNIKIIAMGHRGSNLAEVEHSIMTPPNDDLLHLPFTLNLEAREIRATRARLVWLLIRGDPALITTYRITVKKDSRVVLGRKTSSGTKTIILTSLSPQRSYHVTLEALDETGEVKATESLTFVTPQSSEYGVSVLSSS